MKNLLLLFFLFLTYIAVSQDRNCDPVVLKGADVACMRGESPSQVVAFSYESGSWQQIPMQIDEMVLLDVQAPYGPNNCPYKSTEPAPWDILFYADPDTYTGADTNPSFDNDDELVFLSRDAGNQAPNSSCPAGVRANTKCELKVTDPLDNSTLGYVYLFIQNGGLDQSAGVDYVSHDFSYEDNYKQAYIHCAKTDPGINPENTRISTANYEIGFVYRWVEETFKIKAGNANGTDILDRHQFTINTTGCDHTEETFSTSEGAVITAVDGPVRAIRSVMGANSGPYMQMDYLFTDCKVEYKMNFRLHPANGYHDLFDLNSAASGMRYYNNQNQGGVTINGSQDNISQNDPNQWEVITGNQGTFVVSYEYETNMSVGTLNQYERGQVKGGVAAYYDDSGAGTGFKCTGDGRAYGTSGFKLRTKECFDRRFTYDQYPQCRNAYTFNQWRTHYILPPNQPASIGSKYGQYAKNPLVVSVRAIGSCDGSVEPTCDDGIQNGDETGVDCGGTNCPDCPVEPTCEDRIQNGDETGVDCGGTNCPDCPVEPTCDDGIQNGDETGIDCGGTNCPDCPVEPTCEDGIQNGDETGIDCGGTNCPDCPVEPTCDDGIQNGDETGIDCGGTNCPDCPVEPTCDAPTGLYVSNNILNWNAVPTATSYTVRLRRQGTSRWSQRTVTTNSLSDSRIKNGVAYEWQVKSNCDQTESEWSVLHLFTGGQSEPTCNDGIQNGDETGIDCGGTNCPACPSEPTCDDGIQNGDETGIDCGGANCPACPSEPTCDDGIQNGDETGTDCGGANCPDCPTATCDTPTGLSESNIRSNRVTLTWNTVEEASSYTVNVRAIGTSTWNAGSSNRNRLTARPLSPNTTYEWRVKANCATGESDWSPIKTFTTASTARGRINNNTIEGRSQAIRPQLQTLVYPSPVADVLTIEANQALSSITIIDLTGRVLENTIVSDTNTQIQQNVTHLQAGTYFIRVQTISEVQMVKFVKE